jgi:hypothetical protein
MLIWHISSMKSSVTIRRLQMKEPEDEAFDELAKRQGDWGLQGSRKHQIIRYAENNARNEVIEEVAREIDKFAGAFGRDTVQSFAAYVRGMKK